ncbi:MAG: hypothetical protein HOF74_06275 [Gammaproteobacteria bacterium]|jgi:3-oxoacyl-[acyl-carrier-protein] synthase III|nr:hypothetical protein [Gammaproteobacteria bacterium]MBT3859420.1 hypothetical protein [Gammaproteobacteria bacterium]MBT3988182.1 hypothetical protein [Gammaproteobacteria bacterium]MBT4256021.1 hypothetical protein [Gammaproteobacteria bacterium]MBT4583353.1 hypothetical protein [Gammaproteobacteria bacterium]
MIKARIDAVGSYIGENEVSTRDLLANAHFDRFDKPFDLVESALGISSVRQVQGSIRPGDIAIKAAESALAKSEISNTEIDAVFYCGMTSDYTEPSTAHKIADELGINAPFCWDQADACHGLSTGLITANALIRNGQIRNALVCTGERASKGTDFITDQYNKDILTERDINDTIGAFTVGDAGGAFIVSQSDNEEGIEFINTECDSRQRKLCYVDWEDSSFAMKMGLICSRTIKLVSHMLPKTLNSLGWERNDIDFMLPHQVGKRPFDIYLNSLFKLPSEKSIATYKDMGNLTSASIAVSWDLLESAGRLKKKDKMFIVSTGSGIVASQMGITL